MNRQERAPVPAPAQLIRPQLDGADIVIVGNGIAGLTAAVEARRLAPDKRIVIITEQVHPTINTPALKQFAIGKLAREQLLAYPAGTERAERIHVVTARVEEIHANSKYVSLNGGRGFGYESLVLATGSKPLGLPADLPGRDFDGVCTLHRLQDYLDLRRRLNEVSEAVVIGGGAHAVETVMGLRHRGIRVHWLIRSETFMSSILDDVASEMVLERVRHTGCVVHTETEVVGIIGRVGAVAGVVTNQQEMIPCQLVITCTGTAPVTALAQRCTQPLRHQRGILVDDQLRTSVQNVYAAGDVAALKNPISGNYETRAQWYAAVLQGRTVAASITGHEELARQPFGVQWHATHLGELSMLTIGNPLNTNELVTTLTDTSQGTYRRMAIVNDRLIGYLALGSAQPDSLAIKKIIDEGSSVRDITKELLKGTFDARKHLSRQHTRTAQGILTSGKLPALTGVHDPISHVQLRPVTRKLEELSPARETEGLATVSPVSPISALSPESEQYRTVRPVQPREPRQPRQPRQTEPLTEPTPVASAARTHNRRDTGDDHPLLYEEEISPFTGNLPSLQAQRVVESTLIPVPLQSASHSTASTRKLWSYGHTLSVKKQGSRGQQGQHNERCESQRDTSPGQRRRSSRGLLSYSNTDDNADSLERGH